MWRRIGLAWVTVGRTFGAWVAPMGTLTLLLALRVVVTIGLVLDVVLWPALSKFRPKSPVVIVGNPRSGTTFLHRFLVEQRIGAGHELWQMMFPSKALRHVVRPLLPLLEAISPARHHSTVAHETGLTSVETDDAAMLFRYFDGFFLYGFILAFAEEDHRGLFEPAQRDTSKRDFDWWERLWRTQAFGHESHRVVAKLFSLGVRLPAFMARFPDAKILYMVRDPVEVIPSGLSLVTGVLDKRFGFWRLPEATRRRYLDRLYDAFVLLLRSFHDDWVSGRTPQERVMIVRFDRLMTDFEGLMEEMIPFVGAPRTDALASAVAQAGAEQRAFRSKHTYDADKFGIAEERIRRDCSFVYETFLRD
jgi:omega-hydroxy-beta-dihydromenaquinone-9 sulfotransferase